MSALIDSPSWYYGVTDAFLTGMATIDSPSWYYGVTDAFLTGMATVYAEGGASAEAVADIVLGMATARSVGRFLYAAARAPMRTVSACCGDPADCAECAA